MLDKILKNAYKIAIIANIFTCILLIITNDFNQDQFLQNNFIQINKTSSLNTNNIFTKDTKDIHIFRSECYCRKNEEIYVVKYDKKYSVFLKNNSNNKFKELFSMKIDEFLNLTFTCDLYNDLRRGLNQKIIGYSLYGRKQDFYDRLKEISKQIKNLYSPEWKMRVYYDKSINQSFICELECLEQNNKTNVMIDNSDFCDINKIYFNFSSYLSDKSFNADFIHSMKWRWLFLF